MDKTNAGSLMYPSEYVTKGSDAEALAKDILGFRGAMISSSKSWYSDEHPRNLVVFNANVFMGTLGKVWYGDLDVTVSARELQALADKSGLKVYVLREYDGRFDNENQPNPEQFSQITFNPKESPTLKGSHGMESYYEIAKRGRYAGRPVLKKEIK